MYPCFLGILVVRRRDAEGRFRLFRDYYVEGPICYWIVGPVSQEIVPVFLGHNHNGILNRAGVDAVP